MLYCRASICVEVNSVALEETLETWTLQKAWFNSMSAFNFSICLRLLMIGAFNPRANIRVSQWVQSSQVKVQ